MLRNFIKVDDSLNKDFNDTCFSISVYYYRFIRSSFDFSKLKIPYELLIFESMTQDYGRKIYSLEVKSGPEYEEYIQMYKHHYYMALDVLDNIAQSCGKPNMVSDFRKLWSDSMKNIKVTEIHPQGVEELILSLFRAKFSIYQADSILDPDDPDYLDIKEDIDKSNRNIIRLLYSNRPVSFLESMDACACSTMLSSKPAHLISCRMDGIDYTDMFDM